MMSIHCFLSLAGSFSHRPTLVHIRFNVSCLPVRSELQLALRQAVMEASERTQAAARNTIQLIATMLAAECSMTAPLEASQLAAFAKPFLGAYACVISCRFVYLFSACQTLNIYIVVTNCNVMIHHFLTFLYL
jgi:ABC-type xylose transport system permease subunit